MSTYAHLVVFSSEIPRISFSCLYVKGTDYLVDDFNTAYNRTTECSYSQDHYIIVTVHLPTLDVIACELASSYPSKES